MATFSTLRSTNFDQRFAQFTKVYVAHRPLVQRFLTTSFVFYVLGTTYRGLSARPGSSSKKTKATADGKDLDQAARGKPPRVAVRYLCADDCLWVSDLYYCFQVDALFYQRLSIILRIVIPSIRSKEALLLVMHSSLLIFRTAISLYVAALDGKCVG